MSKSKRFLLLCQHFYPEMISTGMHMTELSLALKTLGWDVSVCAAQPTLLLDEMNKKIERDIEYEGIKIHRVKSMGKHSGNMANRFLFAFSYFLLSLFYTLGRIKKIDGIIMTTNPPFLGLLGLIAKKLFKKQYLYIVYDVYPDIAVNLGVIKKNGFVHKVWEKVSRIILANSACNVVIGRDMLEIIAEKVPNDRKSRITMIPNWSDDDVVFPVSDQNNELKREYCEGFDFIVQYSGRMARTHNIEPLIDAAEILADQAIQFQFIGDGAKKKGIQKFVENRKLTNVRFYPYQPMGKLNEALSMADIAVVCLGMEYSGLSVPSKAYGIMASARPILGFLSPDSEIGRMISEVGCGIVMKNPNGKSVAETILSLRNDRKELKAMGERGYAEFKKNYTLKVAANRYSKKMDEIFN